jgi:phosphatidylglycerophosphatase A
VRLWLAQGFGIGKIPVAPGTFGSVLGIGWFALLAATRSWWGLGLGTLAGAACSVWLCGYGEKCLGKKDPGSVVLDEVSAMPLCFFAWVALLPGAFPAPSYFFSAGNWLLTLGVFTAFRIFDVWKPWPVRQSQSLPGGWGITVDDFLAAAYVNVLFLVLFALKLVRV